MTKRIYYAVRLWDGRNTTTGSPNEKTRRLSIACDMYVFSSKKERDNYVENANSHKTYSVTKKELRQHHLGMTIADFNHAIAHEA